MFIKEGKTNWKYILIVVILAFFVGGGILGYYYWLMPKEEIEPPAEEEIKTPKEVDNRLLLTEKNAEEVWKKECYPKESDVCYTFNYNSPTTEVLYINKEKGISLKIPYNPNWGTKGFKILPYWEGAYEGGYEENHKDKLEFGPLSFCLFRAYCRLCTLSFLPPRSAEEAVAALEEEADLDIIRGVPYSATVQKETIIKERINDHTVISYEVIGRDEDDAHSAYLSVMEVIGKKYNYEFTDTIGSGYVEDKIEFSCSKAFSMMKDIKDIRKDIIKTIQFIE